MQCKHIIKNEQQYIMGQVRLYKLFKFNITRIVQLKIQLKTGGETCEKHLTPHDYITLYITKMFTVFT